MKTKLLFITILLFAFKVKAQVTIETSMGAGYADQVFYKLSTETETVVPSNSWDLAFLRVSAMATDIRVNAQLGTQVFEASNEVSNWDAIDVSNEASWSLLYNSDTEWSGAFMQGSASFGYGEYNPVTHHVVGTIIFVLKYADGTYIKFINEDYYGGYTFKYATWDGAAWSADNTVVIPNTTNPDNEYNYYSLQNNEEVIVAPAIGDWDFQFTKYFADVTGEGDMYLVTGVLHSNGIVVAQTDGDAGDPDALTYTSDINTIGYDWKSYGGGGYTINENQKYYIKYEDGTIYKIYFTEFDGMGTGDTTFVMEGLNVGIEDVTTAISFGVFPNPSTDKIINVVYDVTALQTTNNKLAIYTINGTEVYHTEMANVSGFYNKTINLSQLASGVYIVQFQAGDNIATKRLVLK